MLPPRTPAFVCIGATIGKVCLTETASFTNQQLNSIVVDQNAHDPLYVYYTLTMVAEGIKSLAGGAATPIINKSSFSEVEVLAPPLPTQRRIASVLSAYDDLIENNTRRIAILEEMARRLYEEWFVQFRFPGHEVAEFVGGLPSGWKEGTLQDVITLQRGFDLPAKQREPGDHPVFAATGWHGTHAEAKVKGPGIVTGRSGSLGTVTYIEQDFWPLNTTLWGKQYPLGSVLFAFFLLSSIDLKGFNAGAAVPTLNRNDIHKLPVLLPPKQVLRQFDEAVQPMFDLKRNLQRKNTNLRAQRDLLLPKLISGEIDVSDLPLPGADEQAA